MRWEVASACRVAPSMRKPDKAYAGLADATSVKNMNTNRPPMRTNEPAMRRETAKMKVLEREGRYLATSRHTDKEVARPSNVFA
jgi:hypothetical protein